MPPTGLPHDPSASHAGVPSVILPERSPRPAVSPITPPAPQPRPLSGIAQEPTFELAQQEPSAPRPAHLPSEDSAVSDSPAHRAPEPEVPAEPYNGPDTTNRSSIESWMAELRSSRRHIGRVPEEGKHHGGDGRTVSVNELLRRRERE